MYETLISSLVVVAFLTLVHLAIRKIRTWRSRSRAVHEKAVSDWQAKENADFQVDKNT